MARSLAASERLEGSATKRQHAGQQRESGPRPMEDTAELGTTEAVVAVLAGCSEILQEQPYILYAPVKNPKLR